MRKLTIALLAALAVAVLAVACGDDDDSGDTDTSPTETTSTRTARPSRTEDAEPTPTDDAGEKTPSNETPDESTPAPTEAGSEPTPAAEGTPATVIEDPNEFFSSKYPGQSIARSECGFSPVTYVVTCGSDKYAPNPPLTGQDVSCVLLSVDNAPVAINCNSQEPLQSIYYEIQG